MPQTKEKENVMSRMKTISSVELEIKKAENDLIKAKAKYDGIAETLKALQAEKKVLQGRIIMDSFVKSGKSMDEVMIFLGSGRK